MFTLRTNVKGLILIIILSIVLMDIKSPYSFNHDNSNNSIQIHSNNEEPQPKSAPESVKPKNQVNTVEEANAKNNQDNSQQIAINKTHIDKQLSRGGSINNEIDITLTFYSSLGVENGGFTGINCSGKKLTPGTVANNVLPLGTKIYTEEFGTLTVSDRGGDNFNTIHRLDVYVPRERGESDRDYLRRVNAMGRVKVKGYIS